MFDAGFWEVFVVLLLGLLVLGPERLPRVLRMIGLWMGRARATFYSLRSEMEKELRVEEMAKAQERLRSELNEVKSAARDLERQIEAEPEPKATAREEQAPVDRPPTGEVSQNEVSSPEREENRERG